MTNETFIAKNFQSHGIWMHYIRENGARIFIARFKHRGTPVTNRAAFKRALKNTSVDQYVANLKAGQTPVHAAGLYDALVDYVDQQRAARA